MTRHPRTWERTVGGRWVHAPRTCRRPAERCRYCFQLNCRPCAGDHCTWCRRHLDKGKK